MSGPQGALRRGRGRPVRQLQVGRRRVRRPGESPAEVSLASLVSLAFPWPVRPVRASSEGEAQRKGKAAPNSQHASRFPSHPSPARPSPRLRHFQMLLCASSDQKAARSERLTSRHPCRPVFQKESSIQLRPGSGGGAGWKCRGTALQVHRRRSPAAHGQSREASVRPEWNLLPAPERGQRRPGRHSSAV